MSDGVDGGRDQVDSLVNVFGHKTGPRTSFLNHFYSVLEMVTGRAADSSFVLNK